MYRAVALAATRRGVAPEDEDALEDLLATSAIDLDSGRGRVLLDGQDISEAIRQPDITRRAGAYANVPLVRHALVAQQQQLGQSGGVVAEGRDIAAVVFPDAELKIALVADLDEARPAAASGIDRQRSMHHIGASPGRDPNSRSGRRRARLRRYERRGRDRRDRHDLHDFGRPS